MPKGPLGFPRLTSIGPLVTDGGQDEITLDMTGIIVDEEALGVFENGMMIEVASLPGDNGMVDIKEAGKAGMATVSVEDLREGVRFP